MKSGSWPVKIVRVFRAAPIRFAALLLLLIIIFTSGSYYKDYKHEHTPLGITRADVEKEWGAPNAIAGETRGRLIYYYDRNWPREYYRFIFNKDSILIGKAVY